MTEFDKARHTLERVMLPKLFIEEKANLLNSILEKEGRFFTDAMIVYFGLTDKSYRADDFKVYLQRAKSEDKFFDFLLVRLSDSENNSSADSICFCLEETTGEVMYFLSVKAPGGVRELCSTDGADWKSHGILPEDPDKEFQFTANIFIRLVHEMHSSYDD